MKRIPKYPSPIANYLLEALQPPVNDPIKPPGEDVLPGEMGTSEFGLKELMCPS